MKLSAELKEIRKQLIDVSRGMEKTYRPRLISYKELWEKNRSTPWGRGCTREVVNWIVVISDYDHIKGIPPLNALIIRKDKGRPGASWEEWHGQQKRSYRKWEQARDLCWKKWKS